MATEQAVARTFAALDSGSYSRPLVESVPDALDAFLAPHGRLVRLYEADETRQGWEDLCDVYRVVLQARTGIRTAKR